jgi:hypothetical protein
MTQMRASMGWAMKKISLLMIFALFAATTAGAAPKKKSDQLTYEEAMAQNAKSWRLVQEGLPLVLPSWAIPIYFMMYPNGNKPQPNGQKKR